MQKHRIFKFLLLIITVFATILIFEFLATNSLFTNSDKHSNNQDANDIEDNSAHPGYVIRTEGCSIPDLPITNRKIRKYIYNVRQIRCNNGKQALFEANLTSIYLQKEVMPSYNLTRDNLKCCFQYFKSAYSEMYTECVFFEDTSHVDEAEDFVKLTCWNSKQQKMIYQDFFHFISNKFQETSDSSRNPDENDLNVLIIGVDSVSRVDLHRQMPKTAKYLSKLDAVEMLGYNKIADNTFPNLIAMLTGHNQEELRGLCWFDNDAVFDDCEFIWDKFKGKGYVTAFGEDAAGIGMFSYLRGGFRTEPTNYYYNFFDLEAEKTIGNNKLASVNHCLGSRRAYTLLLKYALNYSREMLRNKRKFFGFFWETSLTHDYFNLAKQGDDDFEKLLMELHTSGVLNKTLLILMSDHGMRFGEFRNTYQGSLEDRLPFAFFVLPDWFKKTHFEGYNALKLNAKRLTTHFDMFETLQHVLNLKIDANTKGMKRGMSLLTPITEKRTCEDAGIDPHWCACKESRRVDFNDPQILLVVEIALNYIQEILDNYKNCYRLKSDRILDARLYGYQNQSSFQDYGVMFRTTPGGGIFEATIRKSTDGFKVMGSISRLNFYGNQSRCVEHDAYAKLFCFCK